ncbi:hypothetical protein NP233_g1660 [Leucocoprinus birnbaumii]|uniref:NACHT domain-containing protein n=1 Tax=Leucocoprinus birnbaumii TaxID=56174 RepID=A0AAD5YUM6_9AGAR|nr:hypothetical protein NP233_g1660 [Leucocoprinus birnbaumii]
MLTQGHEMNPSESEEAAPSNYVTPAAHTGDSKKRKRRLGNEKKAAEESTGASQDDSDDGHLLPKSKQAKVESNYEQHTAGIFSHAKNTVINNSVFQNVQSVELDSFMSELLKHTISDAAFDSSARDPPPRCHPGTRLSSMRRLLAFSKARESLTRLLWLTGPAGVGKSAIMQSVAESTDSFMAIFFFRVNLWDNVSRVIPTLAFQIAAQHLSYRDFIRRSIGSDPTLPTKSLKAQFDSFIVRPFARGTLVISAPLLILIDGLDECRGIDSQCQLLGLVTAFISEHPSAPIVWVIASRPEPHITSFFDLPKHKNIYVKEGISVSSDESCADVERYLRAEFGRIRQSHDALRFFHQWPKEKDFILIASTAKGLFAYSSTAARFIGDPAYGDPDCQLLTLLSVIEATEHRDDHHPNPMAQLYGLYDHIYERIPSKHVPTVKEIYLSWNRSNFGDTHSHTVAEICDWLSLPPITAYGAFRWLHSVMRIPPPELGHRNSLEIYHKSFLDYLEVKFPDHRDEAIKQNLLCSLRVLGQIPERPVKDFHEVSRHIELVWPREDEHLKTHLRYHSMYKRASASLARHLGQGVVKSAAVGNTSLRHGLRVMHPFTAYNVLYALDQRPEFLSGPQLQDNEFITPIELLPPEYTRRLDYANLDIHARSEEQGSCVKWHTTHSFDEGCGEQYLAPIHSAVSWTYSCTKDFEEALNLVRQKSPHQQVVLFRGLDESALVMGEFVDPRDDNFVWKFSLFKKTDQYS